MNPERDEMGVFEQLKPLYGRQIDKVWFRYLASNPREKAEIIQRLQLLAATVQRKRIGDRKIYLEPPRPEIIGQGDYTIGEVMFPGKQPYPVTIARDDLIRHWLAIGPAGSGKTTLILNLLQQVQADKIPWLALDWKRSFRVMSRDPSGQNVIVLTVGSDSAPLRINMLLPPPGVSTASWVDNLTDTICAGYALLDGAKSSVKSVLFDAISQYGTRATLRDALDLLRQRFEEIPLWRRRQLGWMESTERAFRELTTGTYGECINEPHHPTLIGDLLEQSVVIELEGLGQAQGSTLSIFFLQCTMLTRQKQQGPREVLRHVTIIDEAQNVFRKEAPWEKLSLPSRMIREVREYGECVIAATQQTDVSDSLLANTSTKIVMRTNAKWDLDHFTKSFQVNPAYLTSIPNGQAIGTIAGPWPKPFLFRFKENKLKNQIVTDEEVSRRYEEWRAAQGPRLPLTRSKVLSERAKALLLDIAANPWVPITQRYEQFGWPMKVGHAIKELLVHHGLITMHSVQAGHAGMKFALPTSDGKTIVAEQGGTIFPVGPGSPEHEYWRYTITKELEGRGYTVTSEYDLGNNRHADLYANKGPRTVLIEIETGKSTVVENAIKCQGRAGTIIVFFTNNAARDKALPQLPPGTITLTHNTSNELINHTP